MACENTPRLLSSALSEHCYSDFFSQSLSTVYLAAIKFSETVRIGYVHNLAILNFGKFRIALPHARMYITRCETVGYYILLAILKFGDRLFNPQIAKLYKTTAKISCYTVFLFQNISFQFNYNTLYWQFLSLGINNNSNITVLEREVTHLPTFQNKVAHVSPQLYFWFLKATNMGQALAGIETQGPNITAWT